MFNMKMFSISNMKQNVSWKALWTKIKMRIPAIYETWIVILLSQNIFKKNKHILKINFTQFLEKSETEQF